MSHARRNWFTVDKQGTSILFFSVVKPLFDQFFDWNCCLDIGSKGKIWKSVQNSLFHWKREDNLLGDVKYPFLNKYLTFLGLFQSNGKNVLIKNMVHRCAFLENHKNLFFFEKNTRNKCFRSKYQQFSANFGQIFTFPTQVLL